MKCSWCLFSLLIASSVVHGNKISNDDLFELDLGVLKDIPVEVASLFEESALDVASSTANIQKEDIQENGYLTLGQSLESVPSVFTSTTWGGSEVISIRGYSTELSVRGVAHFLDDVPLGTYVYSSPSYIMPRVPLGLLSSIEMIRGPGSTLYGTDAFHGVFSFKLNEEAIDKTQTNVQLGSPELLQVNLLNSRYLDDRWQLHMGMNYTQDKKHNLTFYFDDPFTGTTEAGTRDQEFKNASIFVKGKRGNITHRNGQISLMVFHNHYESNEFQGVGSQFFQSYEDNFVTENANFAQQGDLSGGNNELSIVSLSHEKLFQNRLQIKNHIYHWQSKQEWSFDNQYYPDSLELKSGATNLNCIEDQDSVLANSIPRLYCSHTLYQGANESRTGYAIQIKQPSGTSDTQWVLGAGWDRIHVDDSTFQRVNNEGRIIVNDTNAYTDKSRDITHLMAQARSTLLKDSIFLTYGARWDHYSDSDNHLSPRLGLVHKLSDTLTQKVLYGHAYRAPTAVEKFGASEVVLGDEHLKAETIDTYEYVLAYQTDSLHLESVIFFSEWENGIELVGSGGGNPSRYLNTNNNTSQGLELSLNTIEGPYSFSASSSYVYSKNKTEDISYGAFPDWIVQLGLDYSFSKYQINIGMQQRAMLHYDLSDQNSLQENDKKQDYFRTDAYLRWRLSKSTQMGLNIKNLFDKDNALPSYYGSQGGLPDYGLRISADMSHQF